MTPLTVAAGCRLTSDPVAVIRLSSRVTEPPLRALFAAGRTVADLIVTEATLEEAFVHLTSAEVGR